MEFEPDCDPVDPLGADPADTQGRVWTDPRQYLCRLKIILLFNQVFWG